MDTLSSSALKVHLSEGLVEITRCRIDARRFPLGERGPRHRSDWYDLNPTRRLLKALDWLDVERSPRYRATEDTYCNVFAYDLCYELNVYLPRVWWLDECVEKIRLGHRLEAIVDDTVREMTANDLLSWFQVFGPMFGWRNGQDPTTAQRSANGGNIVLIVAAGQRQSHGHVSVVVPEEEHRPAVWMEGEVAYPAQAQAGRANFRYFLGNWWLRENYSSFGIWEHIPEVDD